MSQDFLNKNKNNTKTQNTYMSETIYFTPLIYSDLI